MEEKIIEYLYRRGESFLRRSMRNLREDLRGQDPIIRAIICTTGVSLGTHRMKKGKEERGRREKNFHKADKTLRGGNLGDDGKTLRGRHME